MPQIIHIVLIKAEPSAGDFTAEWKAKGEAMLGGSGFSNNEQLQQLRCDE
jgi:hypothetical protein